MTRRKQRRKKAGPSEGAAEGGSGAQPPAGELPLSALRDALLLSGPERDASLGQARDELLARMEADAQHLKDLVLSQPPLDLLGYFWSLLHVDAIHRAGGPTPDAAHPSTDRDGILGTLEYVHAIWSCFERTPDREVSLDLADCGEILTLVGRLREAALSHSIAASLGQRAGVFDRATGNLGFSARSNWILVRGNRYQVLEGEFLAFVLAPHDQALRDAYGVGAAEIARGIQDITTSMREGLNHAIATLTARMDATHEAMDERGMTLDDAIVALAEAAPDATDELRGAMLDVFRAGTCNLSRHTRLPQTLLQDLAYERGSNTEFFAPGPFSGTPLRTLPGRIRPLIGLEDGYYATDGHFVRDSAYRAIGRGVTGRVPDYREEWNRRQKSLTEHAFHSILGRQLGDSKVLVEVYYRDPSTGHWVETDAVVECDDVLLVVEAKAGVGAMQSPATHFESHARAVKNLVVSAYEQTRRFLTYLASAQDVPLFHAKDGAFVEVGRLSLGRFRLVVPIGLTVESFAPFSAMCKELPGMDPILDRHPFVSMSVDDLFVLNRFLPTTGELFHYLEVRQQVAGIKGSKLFDELDHLGAYLAKNRVDIALRSQLERADFVTWDGFSTEIDDYFADDRWRTDDPPRQRFPAFLQRILDLLAESRTPGWLAADATIRDLSDAARTNLHETVRSLVGTVWDRGVRWFATSGNDAPTLSFWLYRDTDALIASEAIRRAELSLLSSRQPRTRLICAAIDRSAGVSRVETVPVAMPSPEREDYRELSREPTQ